MNSAKTTKKFYQKLGAAGMAQLTSLVRDRAYIKFLAKNLPKKGMILDCACGYGRLTIPLAKLGFDICGIDLSSCLIKEARRQAKKEKLVIDFKTGDMCRLPYKDNAFAAVICMWSSFSHLLTEEDQLQALNEMLRVIKPGSLILIDLPNPTRIRIDACRLCHETIGGIENVVYIHDRKTMAHLLDDIHVGTYVIKKRSIGKKVRLMVEIRKN